MDKIVYWNGAYRYFRRNKVVIETQRLILREYTFDDFNVLFEIGLCKRSSPCSKRLGVYNTRYDAVCSCMKYTNAGAY